MTITLSKQTQNLLDYAQKEINQDTDIIIFNALRSYLEDLEDYKSALDAEKRLLKNPNCISLDELAKKANINASEL